jgi:outer membrane autotransporter protein
MVFVRRDSTIVTRHEVPGIMRKMAPSSGTNGFDNSIRTLSGTVWVTGFGDFVTVDGDANARGYDFTTGGVTLGLD